MTATWPDHVILLKPGEVSRALGKDPSVIRHWATTGRLTAVRTVGGHRRYWRAQVETLLNAMQPPGTTS